LKVTLASEEQKVEVVRKAKKLPQEEGRRERCSRTSRSDSKSEDETTGAGQRTQKEAVTRGTKPDDCKLEDRGTSTANRGVSIPMLMCVTNKMEELRQLSKGN